MTKVFKITSLSIFYDKLHGNCNLITCTLYILYTQALGMNCKRYVTYLLPSLNIATILFLAANNQCKYDHIQKTHTNVYQVLVNNYQMIFEQLRETVLSNVHKQCSLDFVSNADNNRCNTTISETSHLHIQESSS